MNRAFIAPLIVLTALTCAGAARADVLWQWSFAGETGTFLTDGEPADAAGPATFEILDFQVTGSAFPSHIGAAYLESQPVQGFVWSGTEVTQFFRSSGLFTNGSNFFHPTEPIFYGFGPDDARIVNSEEESERLAEGPLATVFLGEPRVVAVPLGGGWARVLLLAGLAAAAILVLRPR